MDENKILLTVFSNLNLRSITLRNMLFARDIIGRLPSTLPKLEKLVLRFGYTLSDQGLIEILMRSRSNIRELDLTGSSITGVGVEEGLNALPNLETLNLTCCQKLTNRGLKEMLRLSRCTLRVLDVSRTNITGCGFKDGIKSLPMLENLNLNWCKELTDSGLLEILSISGNRLKTVNVSWTRISTAVSSTFCLQYPFVKFKY